MNMITIIISLPTKARPKTHLSLVSTFLSVLTQKLKNDLEKTCMHFYAHVGYELISTFEREREREMMTFACTCKLQHSLLPSKFAT
jgi:hypothetical protein